MKMLIFEFSQEMAIRNNLSVEDLLFLSFLKSQMNNDFINVDGKLYYKITHKAIFEALPIMFRNKMTLLRKLQVLEKRKVIFTYHNEQNRLFISLNNQKLLGNSDVTLANNQCNNNVTLPNSEGNNNVTLNKVESNNSVTLNTNQSNNNVTLKQKNASESNNNVTLNDVQGNICKIPLNNPPKYFKKLKLKLYINNSARARAKNLNNNLESLNNEFLLETQKQFSTVSFDLWMKNLQISKISNEHISLDMTSEIQYNALSSEFYIQKLTGIVNKVIQRFVDEENSSVSSQDEGSASIDNSTI